jgi:hypothetical protein
MSARVNSRASVVAKTGKPDLRSATRKVTARTPPAFETALLPVRDRLARTPSRNWKKNLEKNLIEVGYTPAQARETVEIAAS